MSVKRYEWVACDEHACHCDVVESVEGDMVGYEDYAALEAKCAALAAENAGLKQNTPDLQTMMSALDAFFADEEVPERAMLAAYNILRGAVETPATSVFLAEVRAQGVESFAESQKEYVRKNRSELDPMTRAAYCGSAVDAERFAAQLRKGVQS
ncbi:TPA: hypothetical protein ONC42_000507 [Enterobacter kobei]|nr:hypothetical protein [Enterobacter kobei]